MKWIYIEDQLPPIGTNVLIEYKSGDFERRSLTHPVPTVTEWWKINVIRWLDESILEETVDRDMINFCEWPYNWGYERVPGMDMWYDSKNGSAKRYTTAELLAQYKKTLIPSTI